MYGSKLENLKKRIRDYSYSRCPKIRVILRIVVYIRPLFSLKRQFPLISTSLIAEYEKRMNDCVAQNEERYRSLGLLGPNVNSTVPKDKTRSSVVPPAGILDIEVDCQFQCFIWTGDIRDNSRGGTLFDFKAKISEGLEVAKPKILSYLQRMLP